MRQHCLLPINVETDISCHEAWPSSPMGLLYCHDCRCFETGAPGMLSFPSEIGRQQAHANDSLVAKSIITSIHGTHAFVKVISCKCIYCSKQARSSALWHALSRIIFKHTGKSVDSSNTEAHGRSLPSRQECITLVRSGCHEPRTTRNLCLPQLWWLAISISGFGGPWPFGDSHGSLSRPRGL